MSLHTGLLLLAILLQLPVPVGDGIKTWPEDRRETQPPAVTDPEPVATATPAPAPPASTPALGYPWSRPDDAGFCPLATGSGWDGWLSWPVRGGVNDGRGFRTGHSGIDINAPVGTVVTAGAPGNVVWAGFSLRGFGNMVAVAHGPYLTIYAHLSDVFVRCGQPVARGTAVGLTGQTGAASWPHLHLEMRSADGLTSYDPDRWLR